MISPQVFDFLSALQQNNDRSWFAAHKDSYEVAKSSVQQLLSTVFEPLSAVDALEKIHMFRIYKDVRFSKDKSPYKTHLSGYFARAGQKNKGDYYVHIEPGNTFIAVGYWDINKEELARMRAEIDLEPEGLKQIIEQKNFKDTWGAFTGPTLKSAPKGWDKNHPEIELLRRQNYVFTCPLDQNKLTTAQGVREIVDKFIVARPFLVYLSEVLSTDLNGESID